MTPEIASRWLAMTGTVSLARYDFWDLASASRSKHQREILDRGARGALAEIVEPRDQNRVTLRFIGENIKLHVVGSVQRGRVQPRGCRRGKSAHMPCARVMAGERRLPDPPPWAAPAARRDGAESRRAFPAGNSRPTGRTAGRPRGARRRRSPADAYVRSRARKARTAAPASPHKPRSSAARRRNSRRRR